MFGLSVNPSIVLAIGFGGGCFLALSWCFNRKQKSATEKKMGGVMSCVSNFLEGTDDKKRSTSLGELTEGRPEEEAKAEQNGVGHSKGVSNGAARSETRPEARPDQFEFAWNGAGRRVEVSGSFNEWVDRVSLAKATPNAPFVAKVVVPAGPCQFKFVVDGQWVVCPDYPVCDNGMGGQNNELTF